MKQQAGLLMSPYDPARPRLLPSILSKSPPGRSSTLPPIQRRDRPNRPRKSSITQNARRPQHDRKSSRGDHVRRMSYEGRKAFSAEPSGIAPMTGKRWEDLIDAATSATEDVDGDRTPVCISDSTCQHVRVLLTAYNQIPTSPPQQSHRASLPPFSTAFPHSYQASPLQNALTPPPPSATATTTTAAAYPTEPPLPSVESSGAENFQQHMESSRSVEDSSPSSGSQNVQIYCAACQIITLLRSAYACTECICGICRDCVDALMAEQRARSKCPRCGSVGGRFKPFQIDLR